MIYEIAVLPVDTESKSKRSDKHHRKGVDVFHGFRDNGCRYVEFSLTVPEGVSRKETRFSRSASIASNSGAIQAQCDLYRSRYAKFWLGCGFGDRIVSRK